MARIVPARIKGESDGQNALLEVLEKWLDDDYVVFQPKPSRPFVLVVHPFSDVTFILPRSGTGWRLDPETEGLVDPEGNELDVMEVIQAEVLEASEKFSIPLTHGVSGWIALHDMTKAACGVEDSVEGVAFLDDLLDGKLVQDIRALERPETPESSWLDVSAVLESLQKGVRPYQRGEITEQQKRWRESHTYLYATGERPAATTRPVAQTASPNAAAAPANRPAATAAKPVKQGDKRFSIFTEMIALCTESVTGGEPIFVSGLALSAKELTSPLMLLPALLVTASDRWAPVVRKQNMKGGFHVKMRSNEQALLGLEVVEIDPAAPFALFMPVTSVIRSMRMADGTFQGDRMTETFLRWLRKNDLNPDLAADIDIRILTSTFSGT